MYLNIYIFDSISRYVILSEKKELTGTGSISGFELYLQTRIIIANNFGPTRSGIHNTGYDMTNTELKFITGVLSCINKACLHKKTDIKIDYF